MKNRIKKTVSILLSILSVFFCAVSVYSAEVEPDICYASVSAGVYTGEDVLDVPQIRVTTEQGNGISLLKADGYVAAQISVKDTDGTVLSDSCQFKVRGNTSSMDFIQKKSFTFKFDKKKNVLGMGSGKKWALVNNVFDPTLLRNYLAFDFAHELGLDYISDTRFVELWVDGSYRGCYQLYEPVQDGADRAEIDIKGNGGKKDFMLEYEAQRVEDDETYITVNGLRFIVSAPDEPNEEQTEYIIGVMNDIINTLKTGTREEIGQKLDIRSFVSFYVLNEYVKTFDFDMSSVYFYYKDGILYAGPPWDYDLSAGNTNPEINSSRAKKAYATDGILQNNRNIYKLLCDKSWFNELVVSCFAEHGEYIAGIYREGGLLDSLYGEYADLFDRNFTYGVYTVNRHLYNYQLKPLPTYEENLARLKDWYGARHEWLSFYWGLSTLTGIRGDADCDSEISVTDAAFIGRHLADMLTPLFGSQLIQGDADASGELEITDVTAIQYYLADMDTPYPIGEIIS